MLLISLLISSTILVAGQLPSCAQQNVRKEFRELLDASGNLLAEGQAFIDGLTCLVTKPGTTHATLMDDFTQAHGAANALAHGVPAFFPWHRLYIASFEKAMSTCTGKNVVLPYWDGSLDSQAPENSVVWKFLGGNSDGACMNTGPAKGFNAALPTSHCLSRKFGSGTLPSPETISMFAITSSNSYDNIHNTIEGTYHAAVHNWVGGDMANLFSASNDPIFFMHHAMVDKIWAEWQSQSASILTSYSPSASPDDDLKMFGVANIIGNRKVSEMFKTSDWCYTYSNGAISIKSGGGSSGNNSMIALSASNSTSANITLTLASSATLAAPTSPPVVKGSSSAAIRIPNFLSSLMRRGSDSDSANQIQYSPPSKATTYHGSPNNPLTPENQDRSDLYNLRNYTALPEYYIVKMNMNLTRVRANEKTAHDFIGYVNGINGYVSHCALVNHQTGLGQGFRSMTDAEKNDQNERFMMLAKGAAGVF